MSTLQKRYPGVKPFETSERELFFGRERDTEDLLDLVWLEKIVVLFGKSGYGKSSLINAGLLPEIEREAVPIVVRLNSYLEGQTLAPLDNLRRKIDETLADKPKAAFLDRLGLPSALWLQVKRKQSLRQLRFVLIFDQFEEFFTYPQAFQQVFKEQLAELLYTEVPQAARDRNDSLDATQQAFIATPFDAKALFVIRADRLSLLDSMKDKLPAILQKRYELGALNRVQARRALVEPAKKTGAFASPVFTWSDKSLDRILNGFSRSNQGREQSVEAFLLQVLAQNVENQVIRGKIADHNGDGIPDVLPEDLPQNLSNVFSEYYRNKINALPEAQRLHARMLIEDGLVFAAGEGEARRLSMDADVLMRQSGAGHDLLKALEDTFLLRREVNSTGGWNYELSHDTLLKPVLDWREERRAEEQKEAERIETEKALQRALELEGQAKEERRRAEEAERLKNDAVQGRKRARLFAVLAGAVAGLAVLLGIFAFLQANVARQASETAKKEAVAAENARMEANQKLLEALREKLQRLEVELENAQRALAVYKKADDRLLVTQTQDKIETLLKQKSQTEKEISVAQ